MRELLVSHELYEKKKKTRERGAFKKETERESEAHRVARRREVSERRERV